jgi:hypothetical protein
LNSVTRKAQSGARVLAALGLVARMIAVLVWTLLQPEDLRAQGVIPPATGTPGVAGEMRTVSGRVLSGSSDSLRPVASQVVVLHRISADSSGPVDSVRTSAAGTYRFRYRLAGPRSMYIVSSRYAGIAYFTTPLRDAAVTSPDGDITVYDTTSAMFPLSVRGRHVVVAPPEGGVRRVVDVFEVANDSNRTLTAGTAGLTWRVALPREARDPGSSGGDLPPEAFRFSGGNAELLVPFPPGSRQVVLSYAIPAAGAVDIPVADATGNLEVLVEGAGGRVTGAGLSAEEPVAMEGRTFQRYIASPVSAGSAFTVGGGGGTGNARRAALLAIAAVAVALGIVVGRKWASGVPAPVRGPTSQSLARQIAALVHVYAAAGRQDGAGGAWYRTQRAALLERLVERQAVEERGTTT